MALGQGVGQERGQTHGCPWIWKRLVRVSSSCQVASLAEPLPAVGQRSPSCTSSASVLDSGADLLYLFFLHSWYHQLLGPPGPAWGPAPASSGACLLSSPDSCSRTPCPAGPAAKTQPESSREGDHAEETPLPWGSEHAGPRTQRCLHQGGMDKESCLESREARATSHRKRTVIHSSVPP